MTTPTRSPAILTTLDPATRALVRLSAVVAGGGEHELRAMLAGTDASPEWIDELLLQSYLFAGFPRALNAMRDWRRVSGRAPIAAAPAGRGAVDEWRRRGETTCRRVYGGMYEKLRENVRELHPELDEWMIVEGYGKVLSRPGLDLPRRELCIVAACAATEQDRQLHSHLHGARNVGVAVEVVDDALDALEGVVSASALTSARMLWARVRGK